MMSSFLHYNGRHTLWFPRGYRGWRLPRLNPIESCSHGADRKRTIYLHEPTWLFRLRQRLFCFAGRHFCGRRGENPVFHQPGDSEEFPDTWDRGPDNNRTCSYCGSIHPEDLMEICRRTIADDRYGVESTQKSYKVYVRQPGVANAGQGAIKFYMHHVPRGVSVADQQLFARAVRVTTERFERRHAEMFQKYDGRKELTLQ